MAFNIFLITFSLAIYTFTASAVYFPVSYIQYSSYIGLYVTRVKFETPPQEFTVRIDTGSDVSWIACHHCIGCPSNSKVYNFRSKFYNPSKSNTSSLIGCSDRKCSTLQTGNRTCATSNSTSCTYLVQYARDSTTQGYYVEDIMHIDMVLLNKIIFGCSMLQSGALTHPEDNFDGVFGLGIHGTILSQLSSAGVVPMIFSLCLDGSEGDSGGFLYFGEVEEPSIVYTPLVAAKSEYCLNLQKMYVNGKKLNINPSVFATPTVPGIVFDSSITLAYIPTEAYNHFIDAITSYLKPELVRQSEGSGKRSEGFGKRPCYVTRSRIDDAFPTVKLHFAGGAVMTLYPKNYLMLQFGVINSTSMWCMAWVDNGYGSTTVLGDIALRDKLLVHDLANNRFGWKEQNCSSHGQSSGGSNGINYKLRVVLICLAVSIIADFILVICYFHRCR